MPKKENITSPVNNNDTKNNNSLEDKNSMIEQQSESDIKEDKKNQNSEEKSDIKKDVNITSKTIINTKKNINDEDINNQEIQPSEYQNENPERKLLFENIVAQNDPIINIEYNNCSDIDNEYSNISSSNIDDEDDKSTYIEEETYNEIEYLSPEILNNCHNEDSNLSSNQDSSFGGPRSNARNATNLDNRDNMSNRHINGFLNRSNFSGIVLPDNYSLPSPYIYEENEASDIIMPTENDTSTNTFENQINGNNIFERLPQTIRFRTNRNIRNPEFIRSRIINDSERPLSNIPPPNTRMNRDLREEQNIFNPYTSRITNYYSFYHSLGSFEGKYENKFAGDSMLAYICESESDEDTEIGNPRILRRMNTLATENGTNVSGISSSDEEDDSSSFFMKPYVCSNCCNNDVSDEEYEYKDQNKENGTQEYMNHDEMIESDSDYSRQIYLWEYYMKYGKFAPEDTPSDPSSNDNSSDSNNFECEDDNFSSETKEITKIFKDFPHGQSKSEFNKQSPEKQTWECCKKENEMTNNSSNTSSSTSTETKEKNSRKTKKNEKKKQENSETNQEPQNNSEPCEEDTEECSEFNQDSGYDAPNTDFDSEGEYYAEDDN
ncbi:hypothetical protein CWI37_0668p0020 [Hamiltosporidium tvaerminnensis]|uniref:Uncharacterized protein n=2 Tax=Hamiltosporidium TaxID=1176354 RepID=A0A4Q9L398_9MICR|nr:hypothetical protein CWI37_0668p0020 [Hamiltosporidium tvaerminnensis]